MSFIFCKFTGIKSKEFDESSKISFSIQRQNDDFRIYERREKGLIHKLVKFQPTNLKGVYNLAFGDKDSETGEIDDEVISNNGDGEKVLATVSATVYAFTDKYPAAWVYATGSTKTRTRLYRMGVSKFYKEANKDFEILGELENGWEDFKIGTDYEGFLVRRRTK